MKRRSREERRRRRWLAVLHDVREEVAADRKVLARLASRRLLETDEIALLRHASRRDAVTRAVFEATSWPLWVSLLVLAVIGLVNAGLARWLVGGSWGLLPGAGIAMVAQVMAMVLAWFVGDVALGRVVGTVVASQASGPDGKPRQMLAGAERLARFWRLFEAALMVTPPVLVSAVVAARWRGVVPVTLTAGALTCVVWLSLVALVRLINRERRWRSLVSRDRALPAPLSMALLLAGMLDRAAEARRPRHGAPLWLLVYFRVYSAYHQQTFFKAQWSTGASHNWRRRQQIMRMESALLAKADYYGDRFERAVGPDQCYEVLLEIRDNVRSALAGDLSFLDMEAVPPWWRRMLPRLISAVALAAGAIALPYIPGVTASASAVTGIRVGLAVTAVLTLAGTPAEAQKAVAEAMKSVSAGK